MPQFTLRQIFLCTTLVAIGLSLLMFAFSNTYSEAIVHMAVYYIGGGFVGAGIAAPFSVRPWIGAILGVILAFAVLAIVAMCI